MVKLSYMNQVSVKSNPWFNLAKILLHPSILMNLILFASLKGTIRQSIFPFLVLRVTLELVFVLIIRL